jgi:uncharacterized protein (DUF2252 family)
MTDPTEAGEGGPGTSAWGHRTPAERTARGKAARGTVPRSFHAELALGPERPDPVQLLEEQARVRVPDLVPLRYGRMLVSPFTFYRGAALVMASDLARTPQSGLTVQLCGDAHLSNFGLFATPERHLVFDLNDFDETLPGPFEWDVKRLSASLAVAARSRNFSPKRRRAIVLGAAGAYRTAMVRFAGMTNLEVWYARLDVDELSAEFMPRLEPVTRTQTRATIEKARTHDSLQALEKLTHLVDGERRIISDPPLIVPMEELLGVQEEQAFMETMRGLLRRYRATLETDRRHLLEQYRFVHIARKVVGVGSVGTRAWILLLFGRDEQDPLFLQAKEAQASVLEGFVKQSEYANHGHRVVAGQRLMQASSDIFLGWERVPELNGEARDFYIRQLRDQKGSAVVEQMTPDAMGDYAKICGWTLARAHARSGDRIAIAAYLGAGPVFDHAIASFSESYADQNERDYDALARAVSSGRIKAVSGI